MPKTTIHIHVHDADPARANQQIEAVKRYAAGLRTVKPNSESADGALVALAELESVIARAKNELTKLKQG